eukprot:1699185-Amphidinium_carterae.1
MCQWCCGGGGKDSGVWSLSIWFKSPKFVKCTDLPVTRQTSVRMFSASGKGYKLVSRLVKLFVQCGGAGGLGQRGQVVRVMAWVPHEMTQLFCVSSIASTHAPTRL